MATAKLPLESVVYAVQLRTSINAWLAVNPVSAEVSVRV
jgi:hypothetical protein